MMKLLALTALFTFVFALPAEIGKRQTNTRPPGSCIWDNVQYLHTQHFFIPGTINCTSWKCLHGTVEHQITRCGDINSDCHEHGAVWSEGNCSIYECQRVSDTVSQRVFRYTGCTDINGHCHEHGDVWSEGNCLFYECQRVNDTVSQRVYRQAGCMLSRRCYQINWGYETVDCWKYLCKLENNQPRMVISHGCKPHNGVCRYIGEWFPHLTGNEYHSNCTCALSNPTRSILVGIKCP